MEKTMVRLLSVLFLFLVCACHTEDQPPTVAPTMTAALPVMEATSDLSQAPDTYPGLQEPGSEPAIFLPGVVSGDEIDLSLVFHPNRQEVYFTRMDSGKAVILTSRFEDDEWTMPEPVSFSGVYDDISPFITTDGNRLFFSSTRPSTGDTDGNELYHIWYADRDNDDWSEPVMVSLPVESTAGERHPTVTREGILYFEADYPALSGASVYRSHLLNDKYQMPETVDVFTHEAGVVETEPYIALDESFLLFYSAGRSDNLTPGALVGDIYIAYRNEDDSWTGPINLGERVNSTGEESTPTVSPDGRFLLFASNRNQTKGFPDIFWVALPDVSMMVPSRERTILRSVDLLTGFDFTGPVDEEWLTPPENPGAPPNLFEGTLELLAEQDQGQIQMVRGELEPEHAYLPEFSYQFMQTEDGWLVPVQRGLIIADHPLWNLHLEAGRVWQEDEDGGWSRASLPFALSVKGGNATFNGTLTFLFNDREISKVWYQVTQETTTYAQANLWGLLDARYIPATVDLADDIREEFAREYANRMPTRSIEQLADDYPGVDEAVFGRGVTPEYMTWYGVVVNGVNYVGGCQTRFGTYPYCEAMRATSYSTAKTAFASVTLMLLQEQFGPEVGNSLIRDYVPEAAQSAGNWQNVTFNNVIDMATGNYDHPGNMVDDNSEKMGIFFSAQPYEERIKAAFSAPYQVEPGTRWVYRTSDTFILISAMQAYLQTKLGEDVDLFSYVIEQVYKPLHMGSGFFSTMRTADDDWQGQAEGGYGLWWVPDDVAKMAVFLNNSGGMIGDVQILDPERLGAALQQDADDRGVTIRQNQMYNDAFWANRYTETNGFDCEFWVTEMQGVSGNVIALFPNGITYYYFSDNQEFTWLAALRETDKISPLCP